MLNLHKYARTYDENARGDIQALLLYTLEHLILQGANLVQDVNNLYWIINKNVSLNFES